MNKIIEVIRSFLENTGIVSFFQGNGWMNLIMILVGCLFLFLAIKKKFEPYLLIPIAFGIPKVHLMLPCRHRSARCMLGNLPKCV